MAKRALGEGDKDRRRAEILARAGSLFREKDFDEIRMSDLASELGLAKGTLYLYFPSKESLFLALLADRMDGAFAALALELARSGGGATPELIAAGAAALIAGDPALPRLLAAMHPILESRVGYEEALAFKRRLLESLDEAAAGLAAALPPLEPEDCRRFLLYFYAQVVGLVGVTELSPFMRRVVAEPGMGRFELRFEESLRDWSRATLAGLLQSRARTAARKGESR
jgi:AcrR family transcriptional regulator